MVNGCSSCDSESNPARKVVRQVRSTNQEAQGWVQAHDATIERHLSSASGGIGRGRRVRRVSGHPKCDGSSMRNRFLRRFSATHRAQSIELQRLHSAEPEVPDGSRMAYVLDGWDGRDRLAVQRFRDGKSTGKGANAVRSWGGHGMAEQAFNLVSFVEQRSSGGSVECSPGP